MNYILLFMSLVCGGAVHVFGKSAAECKDKRKNCQQWKAINLCRKRETTMRIICAATCGYCDVSEGNKEIIGGVVQQDSVIVARPKNQGCRNHRKDCRVLARKGWCKRRLIRQQCQLQCGTCKNQHAHSSCTNQRKGCRVLARKGWCRNKSIKQQCQLQCGACKKHAGGRGKYISNESSKQHALGRCTDKMVGCEVFGRKGWCKYKQQHMASKCRKTCGYCANIDTNEVEITPTEPSGGCVDTFGARRCEYYAHIGYCVNHSKSAQMKKICHNTCVCNLKPATKARHCASTSYGCCWDNKTTKRDATGRDCPVCKDDARFEVLCRKFGEDCDGSGGLAQSVRKYCPKTCNYC